MLLDVSNLTIQYSKNIEATVKDINLQFVCAVNSTKTQKKVFTTRLIWCIIKTKQNKTKKNIQQAPP